MAGIVPLRTYLHADAEPLVPGQVIELVFSLQPVSYLFQRGHRIRIALAGADRDHFDPIPEDDAPTWQVQRNRAHPSHVILPVVARPQESARRNGPSGARAPESDDPGTVRSRGVMSEPHPPLV